MSVGSHAEARGQLWGVCSPLPLCWGRVSRYQLSPPASWPTSFRQFRVHLLSWQGNARLTGSGCRVQLGWGGGLGSHSSDVRVADAFPLNTFSMVRVRWPFPGVADVRRMGLTGDLESLAHLESAESISSFPLLWGT